MRIRFLNAGDSHGEGLVGIVEGLPAGVRLRTATIERALMRRRRSYGRSSRQMVERDEVKILSGVWKMHTTGAPVAILIPNRGRVVQGRRGGALGTIPRPGHADLPGVLKYGHDTIPPVSERASARSTAMRVAIGSIAGKVLHELGVDVLGHVLSIGNVCAAPPTGRDLRALRRRIERSSVFTADGSAARKMVNVIHQARAAGNSIGGSVEVIATGLAAGIGSHVMWDRKLDARLSAATMSIQSVKAVAIGDGLSSHLLPGIDAHDAMTIRGAGVVRSSNHAGGIEGGMTNGEPVIVRAFAKPIPTAQRRAKTFNLRTLKDTSSPYVRSDTCVIPALSVIAEMVVSWELLRAVLDKFGGDHIDDTRAALAHYRKRVKQRLRKPGTR